VFGTWSASVGVGRGGAWALGSSIFICSLLWAMGLGPLDHRMWTLQMWSFEVNWGSLWLAGACSLIV
jgi:hypothetical protein